MKIWEVIRIAMIRNHIKSIRELAELSGINPNTLQQTRRKNPNSFIWYEVKQLNKVLRFSKEEWEALHE